MLCVYLSYSLYVSLKGKFEYPWESTGDTYQHIRPVNGLCNGWIGQHGVIFAEISLLNKNKPKGNAWNTRSFFSSWGSNKIMTCHIITHFTLLSGGFKQILFSSRSPGEMIPIWLYNIFQRGGWFNHQLGMVQPPFGNSHNVTTSINHQPSPPHLRWRRSTCKSLKWRLLGSSIFTLGRSNRCFVSISVSCHWSHQVGRNLMLDT